jgi:phosphonate transport system ATP-binding protein
MLELQKVRKCFGDKVAVDDVSLQFKPGEFVGILGRSGAGKSTLLRTINRLTDPTSGSITSGDVEITRLRGESLRSWRRRCAMIFQQFNLCPRLDVITNVLIGVVAERPLASTLLKLFSAQDRARAIHELEALDMASAALQRAETLSGGQQQRVAIARAIAPNPSVLLLDEPTSALDPELVNEVLEVIRRLAIEDGLTMIISTHQLRFAEEVADRVLLLSGGVIVEEGPAREVLSRPKTMVAQRFLSAMAEEAP